jgi:hypothetical protein
MRYYLTFLHYYPDHCVNKAPIQKFELHLHTLLSYVISIVPFLEMKISPTLTFTLSLVIEKTHIIFLQLSNQSARNAAMHQK